MVRIRSLSRSAIQFKQDRFHGPVHHVFQAARDRIGVNPFQWFHCMGTDSLQSLVKAHGHEDPKDLLDQVMAGHRWDEALTIADHWSAVISPSDVLGLLARRLPVSWTSRSPLNGLFTAQPRRLWSAPAYADRWVVGLLEAGAPMSTSCAGSVTNSVTDQRLNWSGSVWAFAIVAHLPQTLAYLRAHAPCVPEWEKEVVQWNGVPSSLLHLAVGMDRWDMVKTLVDEGYSPIRPDEQGALPWEKMTLATVDSQAEILDALNMWPPSPADLDAGWKRRGLAQGSARGLDQSWRAAMIARRASGTDLQVTTVIQDMLRFKQSKYDRTIALAPATYHAWTHLSPDQKSVIHTIRTGPVKGRWSLNLAAAFVSVCSGTAGTREPVEPNGLIKTSGGSHLASDRHNPSHFQVWTKALPHMSSEEMSEEILSRRIGGAKFALTGEGLRALAELLHDCKNGLGATDNQPGDRDFSSRIPTPELARAALTTLFVIRTFVGGKALEDLDKIAQNLAVHSSKIFKGSPANWQDCVRETFTPAERLRFMVVLGQGLKDESDTSRCLSLILTLVAHLPDPDRPLSSEEHALGQGFWPALAAREPGNSSKWREVSEALETSGRPLFGTLIKWGLVPDNEQISATDANLAEIKSPGLDEFRAEVRAWQTHSLDKGAVAKTFRSRNRP